MKFYLVAYLVISIGYYYTDAKSEIAAYADDEKITNAFDRINFVFALARLALDIFVYKFYFQLRTQLNHFY